MALSIDLTADLTGIGQRLDNVEFGGAVAGADINGDGVTDLVVLGDEAVAIVFGGAAAFDTAIDAGNADVAISGATGRLLSQGDLDRDGDEDFVDLDALVAAGDLNGDGFADIVTQDRTGLVVVYGAADLAATVPLAGGVRIANSGTATTIVVADVDGDGVGDILVGSRDDNAAVLLTGGIRDLAAGIAFQPAAGTDQLGRALGAGPDLNGDGFDDFAVTTVEDIATTGYDAFEYILLGGPNLSGPLDLGVAATRVVAGPDGFRPGFVGDVDGDGFGDFLTARTYEAGNTSNFLFLGGADIGGTVDTREPADFDSRIVAFHRYGTDYASQATIFGAPAGDVNGDGLADLLFLPGLGVPGAAEHAYILFGRADGFAAEINLSSIGDDEGIEITRPIPRLGSGAVYGGAVGDVNGDGFDDVVLKSGEAGYVVFGFATTAGAQQVGDATAQALTGGDGADTLYGIDGGDTLDGGLGRDALFGNSGDDSLDGGIGDDSLKGQIGDDTAAGGIGDDLIFGGGGDDSIDAGIGNDVANGNSGADTVAGGRGADTLRGQGGPDSLDGGIGNDMLLGMAGVDRLNGGDGNDTLIGGLADDVLTGGDGADIFVFAAGQGSDAIIDFADGIDRIALPGVAAFADLAVADTDLGARITLVAGGDGLTITLAGFAAAQLTAADFLFGG